MKITTKSTNTARTEFRRRETLRSSDHYWPQRTAHKLLCALDAKSSPVHGDAWQCAMEIAIGLYRGPMLSAPLYVLIVTDNSQEIATFARSLRRVLGQVRSDDPGWGWWNPREGKRRVPKRGIKYIPELLASGHKPIVISSPMYLTSPPGFRPIITTRRRPQPTQQHHRLSLNNARRALADADVSAPPYSLATEAHVVGDHAGSVVGFFRSLWDHEWVGEHGWLIREVSLIIAGNLWDGDQGMLPGNLRQEELVAWLAAHESEQVQILLGAPDLERLGELGHAPQRWTAFARSLY